MFSKLFGKQKESQSIIELPSSAMAKNNSSINGKSSIENIAVKLKYPKPKILLLDLDKDVEIVLENTGYFIEIGSLGKPYKVKKENTLRPVSRDYTLPQNYSESEVIISDFHLSETLESPSGKIGVPAGGYDFWANHRFGVVDPRIVSASILSSDIDRILESGGVFIIFADFSLYQSIHFATSYSLTEKADFINIYSAFNFFKGFSINLLDGTEINLTFDKNNLIGNLLANYLKNSTYSCTFESSYNSPNYISFAENKFSQSVSGYIPYKDGIVFIFPQINDKANFLKDLLSNVLPTITPKLFPFSESNNWIFRDEYELQEVIQLNNEIEKIKDETRERIKEIETTIETKHEEFSYLREILTETGDELVEAVQKTLEVLGFKKVIDVDRKLIAEENVKSKMEDLQILDNEQMLLIEVKGVSGLLTDDDALAVNKYVTARMRELNTTKIKGLTIVNHQRNLPPLDRQNDKPFRDIILTNAEENLIGLLTTWELYKLTRNFLKNRWKHDDIKELFYKSGRIAVLPTHYEYLGKVIGFIEEKGLIGIQIENSLVNVGDRIAFETEIEFEEQTIDSMEINNKPVNTANIADSFGIKTRLTKKQIKVGKTKVFRIKA